MTYGLTALFVVGSLWYLDLLPLTSGTQNSKQAGSDSDGKASSEVFGSQAEAEAAISQIEQWEPDVTTVHEIEPHFSELPADGEWPETSAGKLPATPASFAREEATDPFASSATLPFPPEPATGAPQRTTAPESPSDPVPSESERDRIARIFGKSGTTTRPPAPAFPAIPETETAGNTETAASPIIPTSAERTEVPRLPAADGSFAQVDQWIAEGQYLKAHRELSQRYWKEEEPLEPLLKRLNKTAGMIYFAPQPDFMKPYVVQPDDLLQSIAPKYQLSWEYLARLNRVRPERIRPGQELKVIKGPFSAFIDLSDFSLTIHAHGYFVKRYAIGIGKDNSTPIGTFSVKEKLKNPKYYGSDQVIEADDPDNPLGERWIAIGDGYGIHGTIDPNSIGKAESRGCLRLTNDDVAEVYDFLVPGSEVVIRP